MPSDDKWVVSSSGHHMLVNFAITYVVSKLGFLAKIHFGNEINVVVISCPIKLHPKYEFF